MSDCRAAAKLFLTRNGCFGGARGQLLVQRGEVGLGRGVVLLTCKLACSHAKSARAFFVCSVNCACCCAAALSRVFLQFALQLLALLLFVVQCRAHDIREVASAGGRIRDGYRRGCRGFIAPAVDLAHVR